MHRYLKMNLETLDQTKAQQVKTFVLNNVSSGDKWNNEDRVREIDFGLGTESNSNMYWLYGAYMFHNTTKSEQVYNFILNNLPTGITGKVSLHYCPDSFEVGDWKGCKNDVRSEYLEHQWL